MVFDVHDSSYSSMETSRPGQTLSEVSTSTLTYTGGPANRGGRGRRQLRLQHGDAQALTSPLTLNPGSRPDP